MISRRTMRTTCTTYTHISTTLVPQYLTPPIPFKSTMPLHTPLLQLPISSTFHTKANRLFLPHYQTLLYFHSKRPLLHTHHTRDTAHGSMLLEKATVQAPQAIRYHTERRCFFIWPLKQREGYMRHQTHKQGTQGLGKTKDAGRQTGKQARKERAAQKGRNTTETAAKNFKRLLLLFNAKL